MVYTTNSEDCNRNPQDMGETFAPYPVSIHSLLAAAIDGGDVDTAAHAILAHPRSVLFPRAFLSELGDVILAGVVPEADAEKRIRSAANVLLQLEASHGGE